MSVVDRRSLDSLVLFAELATSTPFRIHVWTLGGGTEVR